MDRNVFLYKYMNMIKLRAIVFKATCFFILNVAVWCCDSAKAQDYTKEMMWTKSDNSIVRKVDNTNRLVYNEGYLHPSFMMFTDASSSTQDLYLPDSYSVSDFKVEGETVYFCGKTNTGKAIMGYFSLTNFPYTSVYFYTHDCYAEFNKMESYTIYSASSSEYHIVMSARKSSGEWNMVDSYEIPYNRWLFYSYVTDSDSISGHKFTDIAVTNNYVLATSIKTGTHNASKPYLWYFEKPTVLNSHMFSVRVQRRLFQYFQPSWILVEQIENNRFVTVCHYGINSFAVDDYNGVYHNNNIFSSINWATSTCTLREVKKNLDSREVDILFYGGTKLSLLTHRSQICHLPLAVLENNGGTISAHQYQTQNLKSFDYLENMSDCYIASGIPLSNTDCVLNLYKYKYDYDGDCSDMDILSTEKDPHVKELYNQEIGDSYRYFYRAIMSTTTGTTTIVPICPANDRDKE